MSEWEHLADWWLGEVADDPAYGDDVLPLLWDVFEAPDGVVLDIGCGEGRVMRALTDRDVIGCDISESLLERARASGPLVRGRLPSLGWCRPGRIAGVIAVMVSDHLTDLDAFFVETARVARPRGTLSIVTNHPAYTAPGSGPIVDQSDGEVLWRWGPYFEESPVLQRAGDSIVTFHHRPLGRLLTAAASAGWSLEEMIERALGPSSIARYPSLQGQEHFPRLLGVRWRRAA